MTKLTIDIKDINPNWIADEDFYNTVLKDPTKVPKDYTFESLLYLASMAFERKTGQTWDYLPKLSYETFSNREGWNGKSWMDNI